MKLIPFLSLTLLLISYGIFGWSLANSNASLLVYVIVVAAIFLLDAILTSPLPSLKKIIAPWFQSEVATFLSVIFGAFLFVIVMRWIQFFVNTFVLVSAGILVRLDTQVYGLKKWQSFWVLVIISEASLGLGYALYRFFRSS